MKSIHDTPGLYSSERDFKRVYKSTRHKKEIITPATSTLREAMPPSLDLTWDNILNVPVLNPLSVSGWNNFFGLPTYGTPFTSVVVDGNTVKLYGGSGITIREYLFSDNNDIRSVVDNASCVIAIGDGCFRTIMGGVYLNTVYFPVVVTVGDFAFEQTHLTSISLPLCTAIGNRCFAYCRYLRTISLPSCTALGTSTSTDDVFLEIMNHWSDEITLTIPTLLMTIDLPFGYPDGDISYLQGNSALTIITV